jgi:superfamily II DNA or RNA helicase
MKQIRVYTTRIEIEPYELGEFPKLEKLCSTMWDPATHSRDPFGFRVENHKFIGPRGLGLDYLTKICGVDIPTIEPADPYGMMRYKYSMLVKPRDEKQVETIKYLLSLDKYSRTKNYSQMAVLLPPDSGKTYCATCALVIMHVRTIIIIHRDTIKEQWLKTFKEKTTIDMRRVCVITGSDRMMELSEDYYKDRFDIYLVLHQTLSAFSRQYDTDMLREWFTNMEFGLKITDEAHLCFRQTVETDFCSNIKKNFYLTATFTRSDPKEVNLFNLVFANTTRFGDTIEKQKNVVYKFVFYNSNPSGKYQVFIHTSRGTSIQRWADYAFKYDYNRTIYYAFFNTLEEALTHDGRILVVLPKVDYIEALVGFIKERYPSLSVGSIHSKNSKEANEWVKENAKIIVSTTASSGTGSDIKDIRSLIIMEPYSSKVTAEQLPGRLRRYHDEESYAYELIDIGFEALMQMVRRRIDILKKNCKKIVTNRNLNE